MKSLVAYITSTFPDKQFSIDLALELGESGVDSIELGIPFSDPVADGPIIEQAGHIALNNGFKFSDTLEITKAISKDIDTLWMGYFNSFYQQDMQKLLPLAKELGLSGTIIPDLPYEEALAYDELYRANKIANISFVAPTDTKERIETVAKDAQKFIYLVAYAGITGSGQSEDLQKIVTDIKEVTTTDVFVGFGVNEKTAKAKAKGVDGVIVGSAYINILLDTQTNHTQKIKKCCEISHIIKSEINN